MRISDWSSDVCSSDLRLPEQEVAEPLLARGADHQIGIGNPGGQEAGSEALLVDVVGRDLAGDDRGGELPGGSGDLLAPAVAERHHEVEGLVVRRALLGIVDEAHDVLGQPLALADYPEADTVLVELGDCSLQVAPEDR